MQWNFFQLGRERESFVNSRKEHVGGMGLGLVFAATALAVWLTSVVLLRQGLHSMPLRYAIALALGYGVFALCVRVWADFQKRITPSSRLDTGSSLDAMEFAANVGDDFGIGCLVVLGSVVVGALLVAMFGLFGGVTVLLEVAFEVAFAGVVVRGLQRTETVGNWLGTLLRRTGLQAAAMIGVVAAASAWVQRVHPDVVTLPQAFRAVLGM